MRSVAGARAVARPAEAHRAAGDVHVTLAELREVIPKELFVRDEGRFLQILFEDYVRIFGLGALAALVLPATGYNPFLLLAYALIQGTLLVGPWELGHQCNHGAFSSRAWANDLLGAWLHTSMIMPYWAWQFSHAHHHRWPNHVHQGEGACPKVQGQGERQGAMDKVEDSLLSIGPEAWAGGHLVIVLLLGWWGYILFGVSGAPAWGAAGSSLFWAPNGMFPADNPRRLEKQRASMALVVVWLLALAALAALTSPALVASLYLAPHCVCNAWLIVLVLLQHTKDDIPHFGSGEYAEDANAWTLEKGVFYGTVDRPAYGWLGRVLHHEAGTCHVVHHLFPQLPFYNSRAATEALDAALAARGCPGLRRVDETPIPQALWELGLLRREVAYRPETGDYRYLVAGRPS